MPSAKRKSGSKAQAIDKFVARKRRRESPDEGPSADPRDDEPTDVKLAIISSLHLGLDQETLLDILLAHDGSVAAASAAIASNAATLRTRRSKDTAASIMGAQSTLSHYSTAQAPSNPESQSDPSGSSVDEEIKRPKVLSRKGATLHLYSPADVFAHTPCTLIHNFLPASLANDLLRELLAEASTYERNKFKLFDKVVSSPHTFAFYVDDAEAVHVQRTEYLYNGGGTDVRELTRKMVEVKPLVQEAVNRAVGERVRTCYPSGKRLRYQSKGEWLPNAAFVNCYDGPKESVGWHSDTLTYLGPRAVIGSLSLGVAREFRVRRILPKDSVDDDDPGEGDVDEQPEPTVQREVIGGQTTGDDSNGGQISIHLPHNSLLIMHAEMQEEWKHCVQPVSTRGALDPHPISGPIRINITYRHFREDMHPRYTPRCDCGVATVLRVVQRKMGSHGRYFWMCQAGNRPDGKPCKFFKWAEFDDEGRPAWWRRVEGDKSRVALERAKAEQVKADMDSKDRGKQAST